MITDQGLFYTIEELEEISGYERNTLYNWTSYGLLDSPTRGVIPGNPSKGAYPQTTVDKINQIKKHKAEGKSMKEIAELMTTAS